jgi:hypothetical protein
MSFKEDWNNGWKIIAQMGGITTPQVKSISKIGLIGIAGLGLMVFGGMWFWIGLSWFILFGVILGLFL